MTNFRIARSCAPDVKTAVREIKDELGNMDSGLILYFASPVYPAGRISEEMESAFAGIPAVGCSTTGEMISGSMGQDSIVAMAWHKRTLKDLKIALLENIKTNQQAAAIAFKSFENSLGKPMNTLDPSRYVGIVMVDGLSGTEEWLNDQIGNLTNVPFVGGSAGDNFKFESTYVFFSGAAYTDAAVLLLMEPANGYAILKSQSFKTTEKKLIPTKVDEKRRMVMEFNGKPATEAYAEVLGITVDNLAKNLGEYPVGLVFDERNFFVRSPMQIEGTSIIFYCSVKEGMELTVLQSGDIVANTRDDLKDMEQKYGEIQAVVDFNCCLRTSELSRKDQLQAYADLFGYMPAIGFATYGESYIGHINQTSTMLLLK